MDQIVEGADLQPFLTSPEEGCPKAGRLRLLLLKRFNSTTFVAKVKRCFDELDKATKGLEVLKFSNPEDDDSSLDHLTRATKLLDSTLTLNPLRMKKLFEQISWPENTVTEEIKDDFFRIIRFRERLNKGKVVFKPLFGLSLVEDTERNYLLFGLKTKIVLILLEIAQLNYWACRFYAGIAYAMMAWSFANDTYNSVLLTPHLLLQHLSCHFVLLGISSLWTTEHHDCDCYKEIVNVETSCKPLLDVLPVQSKTIVQTDIFLPHCVQHFFVDVTSAPNIYNARNKSTAFCISVIIIYFEKMGVDVVKGHPTEFHEELADRISEQVLKLKDYQARDPLANPYLLAATEYLTAIGHCVMMRNDAFEYRQCEKVATLTIDNASVQLRKLEESTTSHTEKLTDLVRVAKLSLLLRRVVLSMHTFGSKEKICYFEMLENIRTSLLHLGGEYDERGRNDLTMVSFVMAYLVDCKPELKNKITGKARKKLMDKQLRLLGEEANADHFEAFLCDIVQSYKLARDVPGLGEADVLLEEARVALYGLRMLGRVHGKLSKSKKGGGEGAAGQVADRSKPKKSKESFVKPFENESRQTDEFNQREMKRELMTRGKKSKQKFRTSRQGMKCGQKTGNEIIPLVYRNTLANEWPEKERPEKERPETAPEAKNDPESIIADENHGCDQTRCEEEIALAMLSNQEFAIDSVAALVDDESSVFRKSDMSRLKMKISQALAGVVHTLKEELEKSRSAGEKRSKHYKKTLKAVVKLEATLQFLSDSKMEGSKLPGLLAEFWEGNKLDSILNIVIQPSSEPNSSTIVDTLDNGLQILHKYAMLIGAVSQATSDGRSKKESEETVLALDVLTKLIGAAISRSGEQPVPEESSSGLQDLVGFIEAVIIAAKSDGERDKIVKAMHVFTKVTDACIGVVPSDGVQALVAEFQNLDITWGDARRRH